jgi:hypothetical protein
MPKNVVTPLVPTTFFEFMAQSDLNREKVDCIMKAVLKYHRACSNAAERLEKEIQDCLNNKTTESQDLK